jgi:2-keto-4-pentenoate hydratase/2-oxohepta-3-ene-1,7-dioic acid hydratase in catechol pathway
MRQKDLTSKMNYKIDDIISYCSKFIKFVEGDLILTGTPEGAGPVKHGDRL